MTNTSVQAAAEPVFHKQFWGMDRVVHTRPGWGLGLSCSSARIYDFESCCSEENLRAWFTANGTTYLQNADLTQFSDGFWPTVDPYRLPGTTVDKTPRTDGGGNYLSPARWVGGASLTNTYGVAGMELDAANSSLTARKSWFMFDNEVVCLGAGITCSGANPVETTVENRRLNSSGDNAFTVNGIAMPATLSWSSNLASVSRCALDGAGGYYFPASVSASAVRQARTGSSHDINADYPTTAITRNTKVTAFEGKRHVMGVLTSRGRLPADLVVLGIGVKPNVDLARTAGLHIGLTGAIQVDAGMHTSDPDIYAAGDCAESTDLVTGKSCYVPMGSTANKQGRVAAINICDGRDQFPGVLGSTVCRVFDFCVARTGLTEAAAQQQGYEVTTVLVPETDRPHYMPTAKALIIKLVVDTRTRKLLDAPAVGRGAGDKRMDVAAMAIAAGMTVDQLSKVDLCYAPPYSPALDNIITVANVARKKLDGQFVGITPMEVKARLDAKEDFVLLDVRSPAEHQQERLADKTLIPLGALRSRLGELPKEKEIVSFCKVPLRGYEAAKILQGAGFKRVRVMDGGMAVWPFEKLHGQY